MPRIVGQAEFGGGIFRGRRAPRDSVYDAVNALVDDERLLYRRGGVAYKTTEDAGAALAGVWASETWLGHRVMCWDEDGFLYAVDSDGVSLVELTSSNLGVTGQDRLGEVPPGGTTLETGRPWAQPVAIGGHILLRSHRQSESGRNIFVAAYAGSRTGTHYQVGTVTTTQGSAVITGNGGQAFLSNVEPGMMFQTSSTDGATKIVKSVDSDTQITLHEPWPFVGGSTAYAIGDVARFDYPQITNEFQPGMEAGFSIGSVGSPPRFLVGFANRLYFAPPGSFIMDADDYHELPQGAQIRGISDLRDSAMVFTDDGMWGVSNMELDALDDFGNVQHRVERISQDMILWGEQGIAGYAGHLLVPCRDDVFAVTPDGPPAPVTRSVRPLYREYVRQGFRPGLAAVHRGHYLLPIVSSDGLTVQDVLVCRLDLLDGRGAARPAWTRFEDQAAGPAYARGNTELLGVDGLRVTDLTGCFTPSELNGEDADGTQHAFEVVTSDLESGQIPHTFTGARVGVEAQAMRMNRIENPKAGAGLTDGWTPTSMVTFEAGTMGAGGIPAASAELTALGITTAFRGTGDAANDRVDATFFAVAGRVYTWSMYLAKVTTGQIRTRVLSDQAVSLGSLTHSGAFGFTRVSATFVAPTTGVYTLRVDQTVSGASDFSFTGVMVEESATVDTYFDGDSPGGAWTGTADASRSVIPAEVGSTVEVEYASGPVEAETWTSAGTRAGGDVPETFRFSRRARAVRLRITAAGLVARAVLRSIEAVYRERGRR